MLDKLCDNNFFRKFMCFLLLVAIYLLIPVIILDLYSHYKVHEFVKYHEESVFYHDSCFKYYESWLCSDNYFVPKD